MGIFCLTQNVKMGYTIAMFRSTTDFVLRIIFIAALWVLIWRVVEPKTWRLRILRAALLLLCLTAILAVLKITGRWTTPKKIYPSDFLEISKYNLYFTRVRANTDGRIFEDITMDIPLSSSSGRRTGQSKTNFRGGRVSHFFCADFAIFPGPPYH